MKTMTSLILVILALIALGVEAPAAQQDLASESAMSLVSPPILSPPTGFPDDFPHLKDLGGPGKGEELTGFGGDLTKTQAENQAAIKHVPVILLHGNGAYAEHPTWGMQTLKGFLKDKGYNDSEIWAVSYLGATNSTPDINDPHRNNIGEVRAFIDAVIDYLSKDKENKPVKVVLIGHSLGAGMCRSYLLGLDRNGSFNPALVRFNQVKGLITIAGGNYGLGSQSMSEFITGCPFEVDTHKVTGTGVWDDTPYGAKATTPGNQKAGTVLPDKRSYNDDKTFGKSGTPKDVDDNDPQRIFYAGLTSIGDFVDAKLANTGYLQGADINQGWDSGISQGWDTKDPWSWFRSNNTLLKRHEWIIKDQSVFEQGILPILKKCNMSISEVPVPAGNN